MNPPKAVIFDLGKVLVDFEWVIAARRIQQHCDLSLEELLALINYSPLVIRFETGEVSTEQFFHEARSASGFRGTLAEFCEMFGDIFTAIPEMVQLHAELRQRGVPTYIFSNTNEIAVHWVRARFPFFQHFDGFVLSYEHRAMKPDAKLYEVVEKMSGLRGADLFYLDDRPENVAAGIARGWRAIVHVASAESRAAVEREGLLG